MNWQNHSLSHIYYFTSACFSSWCRWFSKHNPPPVMSLRMDKRQKSVIPVFHTHFSRSICVKNRKGNMYIFLDNIPFTTDHLHFMMLVKLYDYHQLSDDGVNHEFELWYLILALLKPRVLFLAGYFLEFLFSIWSVITSSYQTVYDIWECSKVCVENIHFFKPCEIGGWYIDHYKGKKTHKHQSYFKYQVHVTDKIRK